MNREGKLIKNTGILAIGQLSSKIFTFLLLPLYTSRLTPDDYGTVDVLQTIISLVLYFATLQLESALFRSLVDVRDDRKSSEEYITSALFTIIICNCIFSIGIFLFSFLFNIRYVLLLVLGVWSQAIYFSFSNIVRGFGGNFDYAVASFIVTITSLVINISLILGFNIGGISILVALVGSNFTGSVFLLIKRKLWKYVHFNRYSKVRIREMLTYSIPLIPNAISWWIANASDRLLIIGFIGATASGVYAAANKIPTIYTTIFSVFNMAWSESVSLSMKDADKEDYINKMFSMSFRVFSVVNLGIICCMSLLFKVLIGEQYGNSYNHIYILMVAIFFNSMCSILGGILTGYKDSKAIGLSTVIGAVTNFMINIVFIKVIGLYAASISTLFSYLVILYMRYQSLNNYLKIKIDRKIIIIVLITFAIVSFGYFSRSIPINIIITSALIVFGIFINRDFLMELFETFKQKT